MKTFEVRKNDRNYKTGDKVLLREFTEEQILQGKKGYTVREIIAEITYILDGFKGLAEGYVAFGIKVLEIID